VASETKPFYLELDAQQFKDFARSVPLLEDELLMLESYARYAQEEDAIQFSTARVTDSLLARGAAENLQKLKTLPNVRRLMSQTAFSDKQFIEVDVRAARCFASGSPIRWPVSPTTMRRCFELRDAFPTRNMRKYILPCFT
jgi:hypothetical protein